ncbi:MAG: hypothetical protein ABJZ55_24885 [Fuerstiella sp.]
MLLLIATTMTFSTARAQQMMGSSYGAPAFMPGGGYPGGYQGGFPGASAQGPPPGFNPHPGISPYENSFEQHYESDGLWFKRVIGAMSPLNTYHFNVDYTRTTTRAMAGLIGDQNAVTFTQGGINANTSTTRDTGLTFPDVLFLPTFPEFNSHITQNILTRGIKLSGGVNNETGWRFAWDVSYNGDSSNVFDAREQREANQLRSVDATLLTATGGVINGPGQTGLPTNLRNINERDIIENQILNARVFDAADAENFGVLGSTSEILDRQLFPFGGIALQNGVNPDGITQLFDLDFVVRHSLESYGAGFHFAASPIYESGGFQIRPIVGGRYFRLEEGFGFNGVDSGLDYQVNEPDGIDDDNDFVIDNVAENGNNNFTDPITDDTRQILVRSFIDSQVRSTMAGPEIGFEYEVAKRKGLRITGSTRVGALVNSERINLTGDNIGDVFATVTDPVTGLIVNSQLFDTTTEGGVLTQNAFSDTSATTHISPLFEQQLNADIPIFSRIPVLRDIWQLEHAKFRFGYKYTWIGEVANPTQSIVFASNPQAGLFPTISTERDAFWQSQFNFGVNWEF